MICQANYITITEIETMRMGELAGACYFLPTGMKPYLSSVSPVWDEARSTANFNQARALHPKQGTLRK